MSETRRKLDKAFFISKKNEFENEVEKTFSEKWKSDIREKLNLFLKDYSNQFSARLNQIFRDQGKEEIETKAELQDFSLEVHNLREAFEEQIKSFAINYSERLRSLSRAQGTLISSIIEQICEECWQIAEILPKDEEALNKVFLHQLKHQLHISDFDTIQKSLNSILNKFLLQKTLEELILLNYFHFMDEPEDGEIKLAKISTRDIENITELFNLFLNLFSTKIYDLTQSLEKNPYQTFKEVLQKIKAVLPLTKSGVKQSQLEDFEVIYNFIESYLEEMVESEDLLSFWDYEEFEVPKDLNLYFLSMVSESRVSLLHEELTINLVPFSSKEKKYFRKRIKNMAAFNKLTSSEINKLLNSLNDLFHGGVKFRKVDDVRAYLKEKESKAAANNSETVQVEAKEGKEKDQEFSAEIDTIDKPEEYEVKENLDKVVSDKPEEAKSETEVISKTPQEAEDKLFIVEKVTQAQISAEELDFSVSFIQEALKESQKESLSSLLNLDLTEQKQLTLIADLTNLKTELEKQISLKTQNIARTKILELRRKLRDLVERSDNIMTEFKIKIEFILKEYKEAMDRVAQIESFSSFQSKESASYQALRKQFKKEYYSNQREVDAGIAETYQLLNSLEAKKMSKISLLA